jgi:hypothetical protein
MDSSSTRFHWFSQLVWPNFGISTGRICPPPSDKFIIICRWSSVVWTHWKRGDWCHNLLNFLGHQGLRVSKTKLQIIEEEVRYLGHLISKGRCTLSPERIQEMTTMPLPLTNRDLWKFLGLIGYYRLLIEPYTLKTKTWYSKPEEILIIINVDKGTVLEVLTQECGGKKQPIACLFKILDPVTWGWPKCVQAVVIIALLTEESRKLTFGGSLSQHTPPGQGHSLAECGEMTNWL